MDVCGMVGMSACGVTMALHVQSAVPVREQNVRIIDGYES